jgi:enamine deaminase RidA (YjgF/YER057c/UK114 family)
MEQRVVNPWRWQEQYGFEQATEIAGAQKILFLAGQAATDAAGNPVAKGDMGAQVNQSLDNLETVLRQASYGLRHVVRLTVYTTDVDGIFPHWEKLVTRLRDGGAKFSCTLVGVTRLAYPELMVEIEATAVK